MSNIAMRTLHAVENDGITPQLFGLLAKERKGAEMQSAPVCIPPTLVFERGFVKAMYQTEITRVDGDRTIPIETEDLPKKYLNLNTAAEAGFRLEVKKKLGRDVILKEVYEEFIADTKEGDIVAVLMLCQYKDRDDYSGFKYLNQAALYKFLMQTVERPRAMLQKFVPPKGRNNTLMFAIWSPLVLVAEGRRSVHALHETTQSPDDRGVTFESDDVRLVRDLALPRTVIDEITTTCVAIRKHVEGAERGLTLTRLACYFKVDCHSTLHLICATSIRLQRVAKPEVRAPLDLNCGAASPVRHREVEAAKMDQELDDCEAKQQSLHFQMSRGMPGSTGTIIEEARRVVSLHRRRSASSERNDDAVTNSSASMMMASSHRRRPSRSMVSSMRSAIVLPDGGEFPQRASSTASGAAMGMMGGGGDGSISPSNKPPTKSWQRHRSAMMSPDARGGGGDDDSSGLSPLPTMPIKRSSIGGTTKKPHAVASLQSILASGHSRGGPLASTGGSGGGATTATATTTTQNKQTGSSGPKKSDLGGAVGISSAGETKTASTTPAPHHNTSKPPRAASGGGGGGGRSSPFTPNSRQRHPHKKQQSPAHIGGSVGSDLVMDAFASVPRSAGSPPFSAVFTRRLQQEERVSHGWQNFLQKQRKELQNIVANSPVNLVTGGAGGASAGGGGGASDHHPFPFDSTAGSSSGVAGILSNTSGIFSNNSSFSRQGGGGGGGGGALVEPPPAGDITIDFDAVTRRSNRHKLALGSSGGGGGGHHHLQQGSVGASGGAGGGPDADTPYSRSLRAAQLAYMSPARTAGLAYGRTKAQQQSLYGGGGGGGGDVTTATPAAAAVPATPPHREERRDSGVSDESSADHQDEKNTTTTSSKAHLSPENVPNLIDESQLPNMPKLHGAAPSSVPLPASSQAASSSVIMPKMFRDGGGASAAAAAGAGGTEAKQQRPPTSPTANATTSSSQEQQQPNTTNTKNGSAIDEMQVVVHEATQRFWHLRSAHPEIPLEEMTRLREHVGHHQIANVEEAFKFVRHFLHQLRAVCRKFFIATSASSSSASAVVKGGGGVYIELPTDIQRTSITLDDVAAIFHPLSCKVVSRSDGLNAAAAASGGERGGEEEQKQEELSSWRQLSEARIAALSKVDPDSYTKWYEFPQEHPASSGFFTQPNTALVISVSPAASTSSAGDEIKTTLGVDNAAADSVCGVDYLLNMDRGSVAYVCLKALPTSGSRGGEKW